MLEWFTKLENKKNRKFIQFDIQSYYPSISKELLMNALKWAEQYADITSIDKAIILHTRKSFLFHANRTWKKRGANADFDVAMGAYDSAEVSDLTGLYLLHELNGVINISENGGLYRDDGLLAMEGNGSSLEKTKKLIIQTFKNHGLKIDGNIICTKSTDFLDVTLNLENGTYKPFNKPNKRIVYISRESNHPPVIIKNMPALIQKRISNLSSNQDIFEESKEPYESALKLSLIHICRCRRRG